MCRGLSTDDRTIQTTKYVEGSGFQGYDAMLPAKRHIIDDLNSQRICYVNLISRNKKYYFELSNSLPTYYSQAVYILTSSQIQWLSYASIKEIHNHSIRNNKKKKRYTEIQHLPKTTAMYYVNNSLSCFYTCWPSQVHPETNILVIFLVVIHPIVFITLKYRRSAQFNTTL